jgi:hypothetical protein
MNKKRWCLTIGLAVLLTGFGSAQALTGLGFGVRAGTVKLEDPNTGESFDAMTMFGAQLKIGTLPIIDLEASAEYARKKYDMDIAIPGADDIAADITFRHVSLRASAKYNISPPLSPIKPYVGAGLGMHFLSSTIDIPGTQYVIPLDEDYSESKTGAHALGGVLVSLPVFPLEFFAEGRYGVIFTEDESIEDTSIYAGANFKLP